MKSAKSTMCYLSTEKIRILSFLSRNIQKGRSMGSLIYNLSTLMSTEMLLGITLLAVIGLSVIFLYVSTSGHLREATNEQKSLELKIKSAISCVKVCRQHNTDLKEFYNNVMKTDGAQWRLGESDELDDAEKLIDYHYDESVKEFTSNARPNGDKTAAAAAKKRKVPEVDATKKGK